MEEKRMKVYQLIKNEKGDIGTIVATVVTIILVLGLIAYAVLSQVAGAKDVGDKGQKEQQKISMMLQDQNTVTGNTVKHYMGQAIATGSKLVVDYKNSGDTSFTTVDAGDAMPTNIKDGAVYSMTKTYNANGELATVSFTQIDLSK